MKNREAEENERRGGRRTNPCAATQGTLRLRQARRFVRTSQNTGDGDSRGLTRRFDYVPLEQLSLTRTTNVARPIRKKKNPNSGDLTFAID